MNAAERAALRALADAATPAPWQTGRPPNRTVFTEPAAVEDNEGAFGTSTALRIWAPAARGPLADPIANRDLIVAARNALPALLDALDAAEAGRGRLAETVADLRQQLTRIARQDDADDDERDRSIELSDYGPCGECDAVEIAFAALARTDPDRDQPASVPPGTDTTSQPGGGS